VNGLVCWWARRRKRKRCFHHLWNLRNPSRSVTYVRGGLIDLGRRKRLWCEECGKVWIL
jgi:hypothetical protein